MPENSRDHSQVMDQKKIDDIVQKLSASGTEESELFVRAIKIFHDAIVRLEVRSLDDRR